MRSPLDMAAVLALASGLALAPPPVLAAEGDGARVGAVGAAEQTVERLRTALAKVNAEVAELKRANPSLRNDYRLRDRMAEAEALAQKLTAAEAKLREQTHSPEGAPGGAPVVASPQASPQDGSVELEAKADLLADQARKLDGEASLLAKAAEQMRSRKALRRKAGNWERDPFAGLETSRRNVVATPTGATKQPNNADTGGGATTPPPTSVPAALGPAGPSSTPVLAVPTTSDTAATRGGGVAESAAASKSTPLASSAMSDRQAVEQRLYLDPATAAELRHALGAGRSSLEPEALERGAAALRARARVLEAQARTLRTQSRAP